MFHQPRHQHDCSIPYLSGLLPCWIDCVLPSVGRPKMKLKWPDARTGGSKNPVSQALKAKYSIRNKLNEHPGWKALKLPNTLRGHTVFFPDLSNVSTVARPDMPANLIVSNRD